MSAHVPASHSDTNDQSDFSKTLFVSLEQSCLRWPLTMFSPGGENTTPYLIRRHLKERGGSLENRPGWFSNEIESDIVKAASIAMPKRHRQAKPILSIAR